MQEISNKIHCEITEKKPPTLLMVESKPWNSSRLIPRRLRCIVTTFVEMVPHNTFFFLVSASVKYKTSGKSVGKVEPNTNCASQPLIY